jgi:hypothetical protein
MEPFDACFFMPETIYKKVDFVYYISIKTNILRKTKNDD